MIQFSRVSGHQLRRSCLGMIRLCYPSTRAKHSLSMVSPSSSLPANNHSAITTEAQVKQVLVDPFNHAHEEDDVLNRLTLPSYASFIGDLPHHQLATLTATACKRQRVDVFDTLIAMRSEDRKPHHPQLFHDAFMCLHSVDNVDKNVCDKAVWYHDTCLREVS
jgi:hypothetical protein